MNQRILPCCPLLKQTASSALSVFLLTGLLTVTDINAAETSWIGSGNGGWADSVNWSNGVPALNDVTIVNAGTKTVTIGESVPSGNLSITNLIIRGEGTGRNTLLLTNTLHPLAVSGGPITIDSNNASGTGVLEINGGHFQSTNSSAIRVGFNVNGVGEVVLKAGTLQTTGGINFGSYQAGSKGTFTISGGQATLGDALRIAAFGAGSGVLEMTGGYLTTPTVYIGAAAGSTGRADISGSAILESNSIWLQRPSTGAWQSELLVRDGGTLQFSTAAPTIVKSTLGAFKVENGVISYRNVSGANINSSALSAVTFAGENAFRLNNSTGTNIASYTFDSNLGPANYQTLQLTGASSRWNGTNLIIGTGGKLETFDSGSATIAASTNVAGGVEVDNSTQIWERSLQLSGVYISNGSTNIFEGDVTVGSTGAFVGDTSSTFIFKGNLTQGSNNDTLFNLSESTVRFATGGSGLHLLDLTGSGSNEAGKSLPESTDFSIGALSIDLGNQLILTGASGANALYVDLLDLSGWSLDPGDLTTTLLAALDLSSGVNLYYNATLLENSYLSGADYDLWGGGQLIAIPESSSLSFLIIGGLFGLGFYRRIKKTEATLTSH